MRETVSNRAGEKAAYLDLPTDQRVDDSVDDDSPHALKFRGSVNSSNSSSFAYIGKHWRESP